MWKGLPDEGAETPAVKGRGVPPKRRMRLAKTQVPPGVARRPVEPGVRRGALPGVGGWGGKGVQYISQSPWARPRPARTAPLARGTKGRINSRRLINWQEPPARHHHPVKTPAGKQTKPPGAGSLSTAVDPAVSPATSTARHLARYIVAVGGWGGGGG